MNSIEIGPLIVSQREINGYTQSEFAELINVSQPTLSRWESGDRQPKLSDIIDICDKLGISIIDFFGGDSAKYNQVKRRAFWSRAGLTMAIGIIVVIALVLFIPKYRIIDISAPYEGIYGKTVTITVQSLFFFNEGDAAIYCQELSDKYAEYDAIEISIVKSDKESGLSEDELYSSTIIVDK